MFVVAVDGINAGGVADVVDLHGLFRVCDVLVLVLVLLKYHKEIYNPLDFQLKGFICPVARTPKGFQYEYLSVLWTQL